MGVDLDVEAKPFLAAKLIMDVLVETEINMGTDLGLVIMELVIVVDAILDHAVETDDMHINAYMYLMIKMVWLGIEVSPIKELLPSGHGLMVKGYLPVINTLAKDLDIRLSHRVTKIVRHYNGVKVIVEGGTTFVADAIVIVVPLGVLKAKSIKFEPRLPEWKEAAIDQLGVGIENKIALHFDKGVVAKTTYDCSYFLNLHKAIGHSVLVYMLAGQLARDIKKMSNEAAVHFDFMQLRKILPKASVPLKIFLFRFLNPQIQYLVSQWGTDINTLSFYSYDAVSKPHDLYERLRIPVDNLFFAGEATSISYPGSIHGAFSTRQMAAEDCRMHVLEQYGELDLFQPIMGEEASLSVPLLISRM
ncbi:hypothetical protein CRYUN_Cryun24cG0090600 [Craigia yunnanensis]